MNFYKDWFDGFIDRAERPIVYLAVEKIEGGDFFIAPTLKQLVRILMEEKNLPKHVLVGAVFASNPRAAHIVSTEFYSQNHSTSWKDFDFIPDHPLL